VNSIIALDDLLADLPFSVYGRHGLRKDLTSFFRKLTTSVFIKDNSKLKLLSYSFAGLKDPKTWKTDTFGHDFFFYSANEQFSLPFLNAYYGLRKIKTGSHVENNVALVLSELFIHDLGFRVRYADDIDDWQFGYVWSSNTFSIKIPLSRIIKGNNPKRKFKEAFKQFVRVATPEISTSQQAEKLLIRKVGNEQWRFEKFKEQDGYKVESDPLFTISQDFLKIFDKKSMGALHSEMVAGILIWHKSNPGYLTTAETETVIDKWVGLLFQILFVSLVYDSWIEYFPATCGIQENGYYRNLGAVIVGYGFASNKSFDSTIATYQELTDDERSAFKLISSRINAAVAGEFHYRNNLAHQVEKYRGHLREIALNLANCSNCNDDFLHGNKVNNDDFDLILRQIKDHKDVFGQSLLTWMEKQPLKRFSKSLTFFFSCKSDINQCWEKKYKSHFIDPLKEKFRPCKSGRKVRCIYCRISAFERKESAKLIGYLLNLPLLDELIFRLESRGSTLVTETITFSNGVATLHYRYNCKPGDPFKLKDFRLKLAGNEGGNFSRFLRDNKLAILAMGNIKVLDCDNVEKFDFEQWFIGEDKQYEDELDCFILAVDIYKKDTSQYENTNYR